MLVTNVTLSLRRLPQHILQAMTDAWGPALTGPSLHLRAASGALRLGASSIWRAMKSLRDRDWRPASGLALDPEVAEGEDEGQILRRLTRVALGVRDSHAAQADYQQWLCRLEMEGVPIGQKYHTPQHFADTIFLAARTMQCHDEDDRRCALSGLGIPSRFAMLFDGVPLGGTSLHGRHGTVEVVNFSGVSPHTGRLHAWLAAHLVLASGHGGRETAASVMGELRAAPLSMTPRDLQSSLCCVGGDGAVCRGGVGRKSRPGTSAAEYVWEFAHPELGDLDDEQPMVAFQGMQQRLADSSRLWWGL